MKDDDDDGEDEGKKGKFSSLRAYLLGIAGVLAALALLVTNVGKLREAWCDNVGLFCGKSAVKDHTDGPMPVVDLKPYGIELTARTDPNDAVQDAQKAKSLAPSGAEIRLYKRITSKGTVAWAPVVVYTDNAVASNERSKYEGRNDWDPELVTLSTWCPKSRIIPSPTGTPLTIPVFDCT